MLEMQEARGEPVPSRLLACRMIAPAGYREGRKLRQRVIANLGNLRLYGLDLHVARGMMKESGVSNLIRGCDEIAAILTTIAKRCREHRS